VGERKEGRKERRKEGRKEGRKKGRKEGKKEDICMGFCIMCPSTGPAGSVTLLVTER
jgi:flagellar biosynthesis/type III secretory pathway protein FliH